MEEQLNSNRSDLGNLSLRDIFFKYVRFFPLFILSVVIMLAGAYIYLRYATRIYSTSGVLSIQNDQQQKSGNNDKLEDLFGNNKIMDIQSEIEVLKSKPLMERVVNELNLQTSYSAKGKIKSENIYKQGAFLLKIFKLKDSSRAFTLNIKSINDQQFHVNDEKAIFTFDSVFQTPYGVFSLVRNPQTVVGKEYNVSWQPTFNVASALVANLKVVPKTPATDILNITVQGTNARMCADVVNQLMNEYQQLSIEEKNKTAELTLQFIDDRLDSLGRDLDAVQNKLLAFMLKNNVIDLDAQTTDYFKTYSETDKSLEEEQWKLNIVDYVEGYLKDKKNDFNKVVVPSPLGLNDPVLGAYIEAYNKEQLTRQDLLNSNIPAGNPLIKEQNALVEKLRQGILENLKNVRATLSSLINDLKQKSNSVQSQLRSLPEKTREYMEIKRLVDSKQDLYKFLQSKREETAISRASTISNSKVVENAVPSFSPIKPDTRSTLFTGHFYWHWPTRPLYISW